MRFVATLEILGFYLFAFGARSFWQWLKTGKTGFVGVRSGAGALERSGAAIFAVVLVASPAAPWIGPLLFTFGRDLGVMLAACGIGLTLLAQLQMGPSWRIGVDTRERTPLITTGVFAWVRNPIFSAMLLMSIGIALAAPTVLSLTLPLLLFVALELQVRVVEEPYLYRVHGATYRTWASRTGRFVPGIGRLTLPSEPPREGAGMRRGA